MPSAPIRYAVAKLFVECRFPQAGGFSSCDFRPHFEGFLHNAWAMILPQDDIESTRRLAVRRYREILRLLRRIRWCFDFGDRIQVVVAFPESVKRCARQILKGWIPAARLKEVGREMDIFRLGELGGGLAEMDGWQMGVFQDRPRLSEKEGP